MSEQLPAKKLNLLSDVTVGTKKELYSHVLFDEEVVLEFNSNRDVFAVTNKKVILVDVQGWTGKKKEVLIIPFSKITAFSTETAGTFDLDLEVKLWASGIGLVELSFVKGTKNFLELTIHLAKHIN
ncbi:PH domain-containing protein [Veillonella caviae]|uniref:PH domain-containing protein n=1 Tax=Veillonella caviae TaxID=248316 RepID=UPI0023F76FA1|nr:PH domain-containing protein [Veillonella caviae]MCI7693547.1 PH domain-containing protein [Veillonella caviae]MDY5253170.1 PH domain-containing protein [Veillonella caviae]